METEQDAIALIPFRAEHFLELSGWFLTTQDVVQWGGPLVRFPLDEHQFREMLDEGLSDPPRRLCWMAQKNGQLVGHAQLRFDWLNGVAALARVATAPSARGRGFAIPMLSRVLDRAFHSPGIERIELNVYTFNTPAIRAYERVGFVSEGVRRSAARVADERWDVRIMGLLRTDWKPGDSLAR